jgi:tetratricopeptide (TPR) repeat protein
VSATGRAADLLVALLALAAWVTALVQAGATGDDGLYLFALLLLAAVLAATWLGGEEALGHRRALALAAFGAALLLAVAWLPTVPARGYTVALVAWAALALAARSTARSPRSASAVLLALLLVAAAEAAYGLRHLTPPPPHGAREAVLGGLAAGTFVNPNHFAALLATALPLAAIGGALAARRGRAATSAAVLLGATAAALLLAGIRRAGATTGIFTALASLALLAVLAIARRWPRHGRLLGGMVASGIAGGLLALAVAALHGAALGGVAASLSARGRLPAWRDTLRLILDHPWRGVGPGMYRWAFRPYQTEQLKNLYDHAHSDYLEVAAEWGIPLAVLLWGFVLWRLARAISTAVASDERTRWITALACAGALTALLLVAFVDFDAHIPANLFVFATVLGIAWGLEGAKAAPLRAPAPRATLPPWVPRALLTLLLLAAAARLVPRLDAARLLAGVPAGAPVLAPLRAAAARDPASAEAELRLGLRYRDLLTVRDPTLAVVHLRRATELNPADWHAWEELALACDVAGDPCAEPAYRAALRRNPQSADDAWRLANFYLRRGDLRRALDGFARAVALQPAHAPAALALLRAAGASKEQIAIRLATGRGSRPPAAW